MEVDPRILFAAERTLLAWIRTGLALMGFGFVLARFGWFLRFASMGSAEAVPLHLTDPARKLGVVMVALGVALNVVAALHHRRTMARLEKGQALAAKPSALGMTLALVLAAIGAAMVWHLTLS